MGVKRKVTGITVFYLENKLKNKRGVGFCERQWLQFYTTNAQGEISLRYPSRL